jgi:DNA end-binding protein Ku
MPRAIWKGAISFGLVHVPVALYPASQEDDIDFDWLDKRSMDPVGYKRINKRTGKEIAKEQIVKGVKQEDGDYVVLSDEEIAEAYPKTTQTIEIEAFVKAEEIPFVFLERPYYLEPLAKAEKVYALLREAMLQSGRIGVARVVMHTKEHLAALIPAGPALMLNTLRWSSEIRPWDELKLPAEGKAAAQLKEAELKMARQLIQDMTTEWKPADYADKFTAAVLDLVARKREAGDTQAVEPLESVEEAGRASNVLDLTALLKSSLAGRKAAAAPAAKAGKPAKATKATKGAGKPASVKVAASRR